MKPYNPKQKILISHFKKQTLHMTKCTQMLTTYLDASKDEKFIYNSSIEFLHREKYIINRKWKSKSLREREKKWSCTKRTFTVLATLISLWICIWYFALPIIYSLTKVRATSTEHQATVHFNAYLYRYNVWWPGQRGQQLHKYELCLNAETSLQECTPKWSLVQGNKTGPFSW